MTRLEFEMLVKSTDYATSPWASAPVARELGITGISFAEAEGLIDIKSDKITPIELMSLEALLCYVADQQQKDCEAVSGTFKQAFGISDLRALPAKRYEEAVRYLVEGPVLQ